MSSAIRGLTGAGKAIPKDALRQMLLKPATSQAAAAAAVTEEPSDISPDSDISSDCSDTETEVQEPPPITCAKNLYDQLVDQSSYASWWVNDWDFQLANNTLQCSYEKEELSLRIHFFPAPAAAPRTGWSAAGHTFSISPAPGQPPQLLWQHTCEVLTATGKWLQVDTSGKSWCFARWELLMADDVAMLLTQYASCRMCRGCTGSQAAAASQARGHVWRDEEGTNHANFEQAPFKTSNGVIKSTLRAEGCLHLVPPPSTIAYTPGGRRKKGSAPQKGRTQCGVCGLLRMRLRSMRPRLEGQAAAGGPGPADGAATCEA